VQVSQGPREPRGTLFLSGRTVAIWSEFGRCTPAHSERTFVFEVKVWRSGGGWCLVRARKERQSPLGWKQVTDSQ
jgi:hypothetical protein